MIEKAYNDPVVVGYKRGQWVLRLV